MKSIKDAGAGGIRFLDAVPVWPRGREDVWNQMVGFHACWTASEGNPRTVLRIAAADCYRVWCNGRHAGYGPARAAHGCARVDEWVLDPHLQVGENHVAIEVLSYGVDSYAYVMQPPFLCAELECGGVRVLGTPDGFEACLLPERVQKVERFSKQRPFAEVYRLWEGCTAWRRGEGDTAGVPCERVELPQLLARGVRLPTFDCVKPRRIVSQGGVGELQPPPPAVKSIARDGVGKRVRGYPVEELEVDVSAALNGLDFVDNGAPGTDWSAPVPVPAAGYLQVDYGIVQGGFVGAEIECRMATRVYLMFDELRDRPVAHRFNLGVGAVTLELRPGVHRVESMEPYTFRFLRVIAVGAGVEVRDLWVREYAHPSADEVTCPTEDSELASIFRAARQTFRTNAIDLFTDCMSRERGGYPCDSWFTAQAERVLTGESRVERNFLENYFLVSEFSSVPAGMVPHCYPSDRLGKGQYIPNWALWLVIQLADYCGRTGDQALRDLARPRVDALFDFFAPHVNECGVLEDVPGWIFVEWSKANECTSAVNHPTNMLYACCLERAGRLYDRPSWSEEAARVRRAVRELSWDGRYFRDQSVRERGQLKPGDVRSETCQYHAFSFGIASPRTHGRLWEVLRDEWGPRRGERMPRSKTNRSGERALGEGAAPRPDEDDLAPANMLYGYMLRFELLQQAGEKQRLLEELRTCFGPQAALTGTLWEHCGSTASCNHGFASAAVKHLLYALSDG